MNAYLERTGDYSGVRLLRFYVTYRAMVRAKVALLRANQLTNGASRTAQLTECREHLRLATDASRPSRAGIVLTHGPVGAGKTTLSGGLLELVGGVRIRTDVERKRLRGLPAQGSTGSGLDAGIYTLADTERTYSRVSDLARDVVKGGQLAIVDGACLKRGQRERFRTLAADLHVPFVIVDFRAKFETLRERVRQRDQHRGDASEADAIVLAHQLQTEEPIGSEERAVTVTYDADAPLERAWQRETWRPVLNLLRSGWRCDMNDYGRRIVVDWPFERALGETYCALRDEHMDVLAEVDVRDHLRRTMGHEFRQYVLLHTCSPALLLGALQHDLGSGPVLSNTIALYELADGETAIVAGEPLASVASDPRWREAAPELALLADDETSRVARVLSLLEHRSSRAAAA